VPVDQARLTRQVYTEIVERLRSSHDGSTDDRNRGCDIILPFPQAFLYGFEERTEKIFDQAALPCLDFNGYGHPR
jgi:hypothetical protein